MNVSLKDQPSWASSPSIDDFEILKPLCHGAFGTVSLAKSKISGDLFAIKILDRNLMASKNQAYFEESIHNIMPNEFLVRTVHIFKSDQLLYIVMDYMPGGDFESLLQNIGVLEEKDAKQYLAEIVLALEHLHNNKMIYRDLKPSYIMIDSQGHLKLICSELSVLELQEQKKNMGSSPNSDNLIEQDLVKNKESEKKKRIVGTPDYIAPEVIRGEECTQALDWWTLGVITYEFIVGRPPFNDDSVERIFDNILNMRIVWPEVGTEEGQITPEAYDFIKSLLCLAPSQRLGVSEVSEIKGHSFFKSIDWNSVRIQNPPFVPKISSDLDTQYFDSKNQKFSKEETKVDMEQKKTIDQNAKGAISTNQTNSQLSDFDSTLLSNGADSDSKDDKAAF